MKGSKALSMAAVAALALLAGVLARHFAAGSGRGTVIGRERVDFTMADTEGRPRHLSEWDGKVVMLNFWATWCPPCQEEIPGFIRLQTEYGKKGLQIIGVAVDELAAVRKFVHAHGINYPVLVGDEDGTLTRKFGNNIEALPYTVVIDRRGRIVDTHRGLFSRTEAEAAIKPLL